MKPLLGTRSRRTVLIVEDALTTGRILEHFFARAGCDVLQAANPDTAWRCLETASVDAVILDPHLGDDRSGLEVLEQMRLEERFADVPVVILTGVAQVEPYEEETIQRNGAHLLYKHMGYREVVERLERIISRVPA